MSISTLSFSEESSSVKEEVLCRGEDETDECTFYFVYSQKDLFSPIVIDAQKTKECPPKAPIFWIVVGTVALIVLFGLCALIIWKVCITVSDRREYARFEEERRNASFARVRFQLY